MKLIDILTGRNRQRNEYLDKKGNFVSCWARPPSKNTAEWLAMFSTSPRLAVVDRIASDLASVGGRLLRVNEDGTETEITQHPLTFTRSVIAVARKSRSARTAVTATIRSVTSAASGSPTTTWFGRRTAITFARTACTSITPSATSVVT